MLNPRKQIKAQTKIEKADAVVTFVKGIGLFPYPKDGDKNPDELWARLLETLGLKEHDELAEYNKYLKREYYDKGIGTGMSRALPPLLPKVILTDIHSGQEYTNGKVIRNMLFAYRNCTDFDTVMQFICHIYNAVIKDNENSKKWLREVLELFENNDEVDVVEHYYGRI